VGLHHPLVVASFASDQAAFLAARALGTPAHLQTSFLLFVPHIATWFSCGATILDEFPEIKTEKQKVNIVNVFCYLIKHLIDLYIEDNSEVGARRSGRVPVSSINDPCDGSRRRCALRSEIKEEAAGRGTFAEQSTPSA